MRETTVSVPCPQRLLHPHRVPGPLPHMGQQSAEQVEVPSLMEPTIHTQASFCPPAAKRHSAQPAVRLLMKDTRLPARGPSKGPHLQRLHRAVCAVGTQTCFSGALERPCLSSSAHNSYLFWAAFWTFSKSCFQLLLMQHEGLPSVWHCLE